jgi:hypothetical protein
LLRNKLKRQSGYDDKDSGYWQVYVINARMLELMAILAKALKAEGGRSIVAINDGGAFSATPEPSMAWVWWG